MTDDASISLTCNLCMSFRSDNYLSSILQYTIKSKETKNFEFEKGIGITIKSKETSG